MSKNEEPETNENQEEDFAALLEETLTGAHAVFAAQKKTGADDKTALNNALTPVLLAVEIAGLPALLAMANRLVASAQKAGRNGAHEAALSMILTTAIGGLRMESMPDALATVAAKMLAVAAGHAEAQHNVDARGFAYSKLAAVGLA